MDTVVVVFEGGFPAQLKDLSDRIGNLIFPLRIFPVEVRNQKIIRRWALLKTDKDLLFIEKEEKCEDMQGFISQLRALPCTILIDTSVCIGEEYYFKIEKDKNQLSFFSCNGIIDKLPIKSIIDGIVKASYIFFMKKEVLLTGIRIKNKCGKKETIDIPVGIEEIGYILPDEMEMTQTHPKGLEIMRSHAVLNSRILMKLLSHSMLFFIGNNGLFIRLELVEDRPVSVLYKQMEYITVLDSCLPFIKRHYLEEYFCYLIKKYGEEIKPTVKILLEISDKKDFEIIFTNEIKRIRELDSKKKDRVLQGIHDILSTLEFSEDDSRSFFISNLKKSYIESIKNQKTEGTTSSLCIHLPPVKIASYSSLHTLLKQLEM